MAAAGGGAATNAGIDFQQRLSALIMVMMLTDLPDLGVLGLGWDDYTVQSLHFETDDAIDDLVLMTDGPTIFVQAKRSLSLSGVLASEFSSVLGQFVGQFLRDSRDDQRYVIATSNDTSKRIRVCLRKLTEAARLNTNKLKSDPLTKTETAVQQTTNGLLDYHFAELSGRAITDVERNQLWTRIHIAALDLTPGGLDTLAVTALAKRDVRDPRLMWGSLVTLGLELAKDRLSIGRADLERRMARYSIVRHDKGVATARTEIDNKRTGTNPLPWDALHPDTAVVRPQLMRELMAALELNSDDEVTVVTGVYGAGGFGKTTLVQQLCALPQTKSLYDALLWTTLGEDVHGATLAARINDLTERLTGDRPGLADPQQAGFRLSNAIAELPARLMLVIDDVWHPSQLMPFLCGEARYARLVTTRNRSVLRGSSTVVMIDRMQQEEAVAVLTHGISDIPGAAAKELTRLTGRWPVLLGISNRTLHRMIQYGSSSGAAAKVLIERVGEHGPAALDVANPRAREEAVAATVDAGLNLLAPGTRQRYLELAIFAEDSEVPLDLLELYWHSTAGLDRGDIERACIEMADLSLISSLRLDVRTLRIHDVLRAFLIQRNGTRMAALTCQLLDSAASLLGSAAVSGRITLEPTVRPWWLLPATHGYLAEHLVEHLQAAGLSKEAHALTADLRWTRWRIETNGVSAIEADLARIDSLAARTLSQAIQRNGHLLEGVQPPSALGDILASRLADVPGLESSVAAFRDHLSEPRLANRWLLPDRPHPAARRALVGHAAGVTGLTISADASWLSTVDAYRVALVWDTRTGNLITVVPPGDDSTFGVDAVRGSPNGKWLVTIESHGREAGRVRVWDPWSGVLRHTFDTSALMTYTESVELAISPNSDWIAIVDYDAEEEKKKICVWDIAAGSLRFSIRDEHGWAQTVAASPDGRWLATGDSSENNDALCSVRLWDAATGQPERELVGHNGGVHRVVFGPTSRWLCSADNKGILRIWEVSGRLCHVLRTRMRWPELVIAPDGTWLVAYDDDGAVRAWDLATGVERFTLKHHPDRLGLFKLAIAPDGTWFATGGGSIADGDSTVQIWDSSTGGLRDVLPGHPYGIGGLGISPDGTWMATGDSPDLMRHEVNKLVRIWAVPPDRKSNKPARDSIQSPDFDLSPDGTCVAFNASDELWIARLTTDAQRLATYGVSGVQSVRYSPHADWLAVSTRNGIMLQSCAAGGLLQTLKHDGPGVKRLEIAPDGTWLLSSACPASLKDVNQQRTYSAHVWDIRTGEIRFMLTGHDFGVGATAIAPNGKYLATCDGNQSRDRETAVRIWNSQDGTLRFEIRGYRHGIGALAISPDSTWLAIGESFMDEGKACVALICDAVTGETRHCLDGHVREVTAIAVARNGTWLCTGDAAGTAQIWDPATGHLKHSMPGRAPVTDIAISPDDRWIAVCDGSGGIGTLRIWDPFTGIAVAAMRVDGPLNQGKWLWDSSGICLSGTRGLYVFDWRQRRLGPGRS